MAPPGPVPVTVAVRPLLAGDAPRLYEAWQALREHYGATDPRIVHAPVGPDDLAVAVLEMVDRTTACAFVAEEGGQIVAFISGAIELNQPDRLPERHATVGHLYVLPTHRRRGLARELLGHVFEWARSQDGIAHVEMTVLANDDEAAAFWHAQGFAPFIQRLWAPLDGGATP